MSESPSSSPERGIARWLRAAAAHGPLTVLLLLGVVCVFDMAVVSALLTPIKHDLQLTDEQFARTAAAFTLAGIAGAPIFGLLANRFGRKGVLLIGIALWSLASAGSGWSSGLLSLLLWRAATGFGEAAYTGLAPGWLADLYAPRWRNLVFSLYMLRNKVGYALALAAGSWIAATYDWHIAFYIAGLPGLALLLALLFVKEPRPGAHDGAGVVKTRLSLREQFAVFRSPAWVTHSFALVFFWIAMGVQIWIPAYLHRHYGLSNVEASGFLAQVLLYTLPVGLVGGWLSSLYLRQRAGGFAGFLAATSLLAALGFTLAYSAGELFVTQLWIVLSITAFGASAGTLTTLVVETVKPELRSTAGSLSAALAGGVSGVIGPELLGLSSDAYGLQNAIFIAPAAYFLAGLTWLWLAVRQRSAHRRAERESGLPQPLTNLG